MVRPGKRFGYQEVIDRFYSDTGLAEEDQAKGHEKPPHKGAFAHARKKLPIEVFQELFTTASDEARHRAASLEGCTWDGLRVYGIDGSKMNLPHSEPLASHFGVPEGAHYPQALVCTLFDVLAKVPVDSVWGPYFSNERDLAPLLYEALGPGDLLLLDRGYPSFTLLADMASKGFDCLVRLPKTGMFGEVAAFLAKGRTDGLVTLQPPDELVRQCHKDDQPVPEPLTLRVVKVKLPKRGGYAVFITTLQDKQTFSRRAIRELYHFRWEEEEFFKLVKELLEAENLRGKSVLLVAQEMLAIYLYSILTRILMMECSVRHAIAPNEIAQQHAFNAVSRYLDHLFVAKTAEDCIQMLDRCIDEISWRRYKKRPNRSYLHGRRELTPVCRAELTPECG